jgi:hypothetical protein
MEACCPFALSKKYNSLKRGGECILIIGTSWNFLLNTINPVQNKQDLLSPLLRAGRVARKRLIVMLPEQSISGREISSI